MEGKREDRTMADKTSAAGRNMAQKVGLFLGPAVFLIIVLFFDLEPGKPIVTRMAAVAALVAVWWITKKVGTSINK
jgi:sodium-dependent dicarboxylate transporter 2/3/5